MLQPQNPSAELMGASSASYPQQLEKPITAAVPAALAAIEDELNRFDHLIERMSGVLEPVLSQDLNDNQVAGANPALPASRLATGLRSYQARITYLVDAGHRLLDRVDLV